MAWSAVLAGTSMSMSYESAWLGLSPDTLQLHSTLFAKPLQACRGAVHWSVMTVE